MASVYVTSRGKNKKGKLGMRKDAANNAANKLSQKMFAGNADILGAFSTEQKQPLGLTSRASQEKKKLRENMKAALALTCANPACAKKVSNASQLLTCSACRGSSYCSAECQKAHWPEHKVPCKAKKAEEAAKLLKVMENIQTTGSAAGVEVDNKAKDESA